MQRIPPSALAILAIFSVQFGNALVGSLFDAVGPFGAAACRLCFAAAILALVVRPRMRGWSRRTWLGVVLLGIGLGGMNLFIYLAIQQIPIGIAVTIELMGPLAVAAIGIRRVVDAVWVVLAVAGVALLGLRGGPSFEAVGVLFALVAAAFWALYILCSAMLGPRVRGVDGLAAASVVAALVIAPFGVGEAIAAMAVDPSLILAFLGLALLTSAVPYTLEFVSLKRMSSRVFGVLSSLGPAVAALAGFVVLHQRLEPLQLLAMLLVIAASAGVVAGSRAR
ncbi:EamA family transporter [Leucobacter ruminantium]|uniref:EamA family transporter n=1 Tax=Leucobacter ruminantium TaxID=1289170 RepID=A0A939RYB2_9MICO|nr:EamA family transporter [Leucobacter ruminantium]MBO1805523.1 EamA family transporter [Leucobacter ruminantium]